MTIRREMERGASLYEWQSILSEWAKQYRSKKERKPEFLFAHLHEEVSEAWKEWREGRTETTIEQVKKHGVKLNKPEGLGAELADIVGMALIAADLLGIDLESELIAKNEYLWDRLAAKFMKKGRKK